MFLNKTFHLFNTEKLCKCAGHLQQCRVRDIEQISTKSVQTTALGTGVGVLDVAWPWRSLSLYGILRARRSRRRSNVLLVNCLSCPMVCHVSTTCLKQTHSSHWQPSTNIPISYLVSGNGKSRRVVTTRFKWWCVRVLSDRRVPVWVCVQLIRSSWLMIDFTRFETYRKMTTVDNKDQQTSAPMCTSSVSSPPLSLQKLLRTTQAPLELWFSTSIRPSRRR